MKKPKPIVRTIGLPYDDVLENATHIGCSIMLLCMGDTIKFKNKCGIKYTIKREWEK